MEPQKQTNGFPSSHWAFLLAGVSKLAVFQGEALGFSGRVKETSLISQRLPLNFTKYALNFSFFFSTSSFNFSTFEFHNVF